MRLIWGWYLAKQIIAEAHRSAERELKLASKGASQSSYPAGSEYSVLIAHATIMSAFSGFLTESMLESMKAMYSMRKAYQLFYKLNQMIEKTDKERCVDGDDGKLLRRVSTSKNRFDELICGGTLAGLGMLELVLSIIPPTLTRILSVIGFRGERKSALQLLWKSVWTDNIFGAMATLVLMSYYGNALQTSDIMSPTKDNLFDIGECEKAVQRFGYPILNIAHDCRVRSKYPNNALWRLLEVSEWALIDIDKSG